MYKEIKLSLQPLKDLMKVYLDDPEAFTEYDDEDFSDKTEYFIQDTFEEAQGMLDEIETQIADIDKLYLDFLKYVGDDIKKLPLEDFLGIIKNFGASLEVF
jgi:hypothetical protein